MNHTAGRGMAALGREPVGGVRYGGACYTGSASPHHLVEGAAADAAQVAGLAWGYGGVLGWHTGFQVPLKYQRRASQSAPPQFGSLLPAQVPVQRPQISARRSNFQLFGQCAPSVSYS